MAKKPKVAQAILLACALITSLNVAIPAPAKAATDCGVTGITSGNKVYYIFKNVGKDIAQHIAAFAPLFVSRDQVPADEIRFKIISFLKINKNIYHQTIQ